MVHNIPRFKIHYVRLLQNKIGTFMYAEIENYVFPFKKSSTYTMQNVLTFVKQSPISDAQKAQIPKG